MAEVDRENPVCWLAQFSTVPCHGRLRKVHLIPKQTLRRAKVDPWDERAWVPACGGETGLAGHHGMFDGYTLEVPRCELPYGVEELARDAGLGWWLDRRYGPAEEVAA